MADEKPYHHGDLRAALLAAAEADIAEHGIEAFSLRQVARRAGVSHAAPAHHFGDAAGLLTALAAEGYRQFLAAQLARVRVAGDGPADRIVASGLGYIDFAMARPALFRLMFGSARPDHCEAELNRAAGDAYRHLVDIVTSGGGRTMADEAAVWAMAHGLADLLSAGRLTPIAALEPAARDAVLATILRRIVPEKP